jgi:hypothetical protein
MTLQARIKRLEAEQEAEAARPVACVCRLVIVAGEPTSEQAQTIARNATCKADHRDKGFSVVEAPMMPEWMQRGEPPPPREAEE